MIFVFKQSTKSRSWKLYGCASDETEAIRMCGRLALQGFRAKYEMSR